MYQFKDNKNGVYYHEQKFTLQWDFPDSRWVVVKYFNGNKRVILPIVTNSKNQTIDGSRFKVINFLLKYTNPLRAGKTIVRTEFNNKIGIKERVSSISQELVPAQFGFKRIFLLSANDEFENIANLNSQSIVLFILKTSFPFIQRVSVPMHVKLLRLEENKLNVEIPQAQFSSFGFSLNTPNAQIAAPEMLVNDMNVEVKLSNVNPSFDTNILTPDIRKSINQLIASGEITEGSTNESILQLIN
jgi:hypothetical protein